MKAAAVYIRVSTDDQTEYSPDAQLKAIKEYAKKNDMIIQDNHIYIDEGISGKATKKRISFNKMIGIAKTKPKPFDVILLWKFSRFARNREDSIVYKSMLRKQLGIDVISITENIGDDKMSVLIEALIEAMDEYYSINLAEEVKKGMTEKASRGEFQSAPPFGYKKLTDKPLEINEEEAKYVRYAFEQYLSGIGCFTIASKLNSFGIKTKRGNKFENRTVEYMLNNPIYIGYVRWTPTGKTVGKRIYDNPNTIIKKSDHKPIINEELFKKVNEKLKADKARRKVGERPAETKKHYLSGILKCGSCDSSLTYSHTNNGFQCIKYTRGTCKPSHYVRADKIEKAILKELDHLADPGVYIENVKSISNFAEEKKILLKEISVLEKMLDRAKQAFLAGIDTLEEYEENKRKLQMEISVKNSKIAKLKEPAIDQSQLKKKIQSVRAVLISDASIAEKNSTLHEIVEKIAFYRPEEKIRIFIYL
ncbi:recombinase family protein [Anaerovorax odorimutans]|uniref:recombinase family protein n=1 Tax=Anaerovorax odorimutans TaxID=109327 RepID=UPI0004162303|nr:recombinase family protein [Anaerovorax odorimutans]